MIISNRLLFFENMQANFRTNAILTKTIKIQSPTRMRQVIQRILHVHYNCRTKTVHYCTTLYTGNASLCTLYHHTTRVQWCTTDW